MRALGIDIGTTTVSVAVVDRDSKKVETSYTLKNDSFIKVSQEWAKIQDPEKILTIVMETLEEILQRYEDIAWIGLTGQMHGIVYLDQNGKHVSPLYTWQDERGNIPCFDGKTACQIAKEAGAASANVGYGLITHLYHKKKGECPKDSKKVATIMDYLGMVLTGRKEPLMHSSNAAGLGFFDISKGRFQKECLERLGIDDEILPEVTEEFCTIGTFRGIPVSVALGDNQASFLGSVSDAKETILMNVGTGGQVSVLSDTVCLHPGIELRPFSKGKYLMVGSSLCGGRAYAILEHFFRSYAEAIGKTDVDHYAVMAQLLGTEAEKESNADRLCVETCFAGTREEPEKRGSISGIGTENFTPACLIRGVLDGIAEELYQMYVSMEKEGKIQRSKIVASGNGLRKNRILREMVREKFGMDVKLAEQTEEAAYGAALLGMIAGGEADLGSLLGMKKAED